MKQTATTQNAVKEILTANRKALQFLNGAYGFDLQKPFTAIKHTGKFTVKVIEDLLKPEQLKNPKIILMMAMPSRYHESGIELKPVELAGGRFETEQPRRGYNYFVWRWRMNNYYYRKSDFEFDRKNAAAPVYIFAQSAEHLLPVRGDEPHDYKERFNFVDYKEYGGADGYIYGLMLKERDRNGDKFEFHVERWHKKTKDPRELIDKSGYLLINRREELRRRADQLRKDRKKAEFVAVDYSARLAEVAERVEAAKKELAAAVLNVQTEEDARKVERASGALWYIYLDFEYLKRRINGKEYASTEKAENAFAEIGEKFEKLTSRLNGSEGV